MKETETKTCPYHDCPPEYRRDVIREGKYEWWYNRDGVTKSRHFIDGIYDHFFYCPRCKEEEMNSTMFNTKYDKFAYGAWSQKSKEDALRNWNKKVERAIPRIMIEDIRKGR